MFVADRGISIDIRNV